MSFLASDQIQKSKFFINESLNVATHQSIYLRYHSDQTLVLLARMRHFCNLSYVIGYSIHVRQPRVRIAVIIIAFRFHAVDQMNALQLTRYVNIVLV